MSTAAVKRKPKAQAVAWPPDYVAVYAWRQEQLIAMRSDVRLAVGALEYYKTRPHEFIEHWVDTYDPRNAEPGAELPTRLPFVLFDVQRRLIDFLLVCLKAQTNGLIEKSRDMGATWLCAAMSVWMWLFWPGVAVGWGSRKEDLVDKLGDPDSIFEKMRIIVRNLPPEFLPVGYDENEHLSFMRFVNPHNEATITGEAGDNIGRGGRKRVYFTDESAFYDHPEVIEAALTDNTRCRIDLSTVSAPGSLFLRKRDAGIVWKTGPAIKGRVNVFIMDWREHPLKTQAWYDERRDDAERNGLLHVFAREVDRDPSQSNEGVIIPGPWIDSAIDAHKKLGFGDAGQWVAALDVADGGIDKNALARRKGVILKRIKEWGERDVGVTARLAIAECEGTTPMTFEYDCIGVGSSVKAEINRLADDKKLPRGIRFEAWDAGSEVLEPDARVVPNDRQSPINKDFYANLKAQGWWQLRLRFERTHRAVTKGVKYPPADLISLDSTTISVVDLAELKKELSQPVRKYDSSMRLLVDKQPKGTKSPNKGDAVMMCYWPARRSRYTLENVL